MRGALVVARCLALLVLLAGFVSVAASVNPRTAGHDDFRRDLDRGAIELIVLPEATPSWQTVDEATWSTGPFQWRRGTVDSGGTETAVFSAQMRDRGISVEMKDLDDTSFTGWPLATPTWLETLVVLTWLASFVAMIASRPRWGNRWAWFWMFVVGEIGVLLYLLVEPEPLWRRASEPPADPVRDLVIEGAAPVPVPDARVGGVRGFLLAVLASIVAALLAEGVGWVAGRFPT